MKIVVCVKQVPDTTEVKLDPKTNTLIREGLPSIINPDDRAAIEQALQLKDTYGGEVVLLSMGPKQAEIALREGLAMGADQAVLLSSRMFGGADTWATSLTLAEAIRQKIGEVDLILCGRQAIDGDTAQVGPELAVHLDMPQVTYARSILSISGKEIEVERALEDGYEIIKSQMPIVLTMLKEANTPRFATMGGIIAAFDEQTVEVWDETDVVIEPERIGLKGSPTKVKAAFPPAVKEPGQMIEGANPREIAQLLVEKLVSTNLL